MGLASVLIQFLNGLASASSLFLVAAGLSLIFGVARVVNFAHGSLYMLGVYSAVWLAERLGFWAALPLAAIAVAGVGLLIETLLLRRIYQAPQLFQLLATFAVVLVVKDAALWLWGPQDLLGPRAPGFAGAVSIAGVAFPEYDLLLIVLGPMVLLLLHGVLQRTGWGVRVRAVTDNRGMAAALGINQAAVVSSVFAVGALLAGLGGALNVPREPANLNLDLNVIAEAFVVVVVGGMGSIPGAFAAALLIGEIKAFCVGFGFSKLTLAAEFIVMAAVLAWRPWGLLGRAEPEERSPAEPEAPLRLPGQGPVLAGIALIALLALAPAFSGPYALVLLADILVFALFAVSLHFLAGPAGMHTFGHAAYFGLGAYGAALAVKHMLPFGIALPAGAIAAALGAVVYGWFCVRLSGIYLAMLTLAFAQITWSVVFQWDALTGGSNGLIGLWPPAALGTRTMYYFLTLALCTAGVLAFWRLLHSPFGYALRAGRDSPLRAEAIGIDVRKLQWRAFAVAGLGAGLAGAVYAFSKGSISPEVMSIPRSVDGLVMVLLGGIQTVVGPVAGAAAFVWLQDTIARETEYWRALLGGVILVLVLAFPLGIAGLAARR